MTIFKRLISMLAALTLAACGGGGGSAGTPAFGNGGSTPGATASDLEIRLSPNTIPNTGDSTVALTVTALDANRTALPGVEVTVAADNGGVVTLPASTTGRQLTNAQGQIVGTVGIGSLRTNRTITVTATSGSVTRTAALSVISIPAGATPSTIELVASANSVGTGGDAVTIRAFVKDANNNALANAPVAFATNTGTLSNVSTVTDVGGSATALFASGSNKANRSATITVTSAAVQSQITLPIVNTKLTLSGPSSMIVGTTTSFIIVATDSNANPLPNVAVTATSSLGNGLARPDGNNTDLSGQIRFVYTATNAGTDSLVFEGAGARVSPQPALVVSGDDFSFISPAASTSVAVNTSQS
ncbi:MAG: Ig-like domain-containing protein, partial [Chitinophagaceae bacterium]|nr:Ig-like domain-containing protein [Rubrivivax sp.]